ncbi:MAG: hypothetical protein AAB909_01360, partial [Patescibacteria group bacterium]
NALADKQVTPQPVSGGPKEQIEMRSGGGERGVEKSVDAVHEVPSSVEIEKKSEVAPYMEQAGADMDIAGGVTDDYTQNVLLKYEKDSGRREELPLTEAQVQEGLHHKVWESIRWLAEWCVRQAKMLHGKVMYKK